VARNEEARPDPGETRTTVLAAIGDSDVEILNPEAPGRYLLVAKFDDDALSDRRAAFHPSEDAAREAIMEVPVGWWPDCLIDLDVPIDVAVRDAAAADGSLGDPYPFDADHVIFA
jgi:hypothetical protein